MLKVLLVWLVLSVPLAILVGKVLKGRPVHPGRPEVTVLRVYKVPPDR